MAPYYEDSLSGSEDDAPESVSLAQSKGNIKKSDDALQQVHAAEKLKKKLRNKEKDRRLKEQAENSKRKRKNAGDVNLEAQMERAVQGAAEEMNEDDDSGENGSSNDEDEEDFRGICGDSEEDSGQVSDDIDPDREQDDEEMDFEDRQTTKTNPNHLPDHLFASAFASTTGKTPLKRKVKQGSSTRSSPIKRSRSNAAPKDVLIGWLTYTQKVTLTRSICWGFYATNSQSQKVP
ncbi:hypothetical protein C0992_004969 [Termitomyces sp. T32_za158]|nr:hypothetical protein C0992_004969 [Termitomyces sp. T32_za158]